MSRPGLQTSKLSRRRAGAFTLAEALLASVVLAIAVVGISQLTSASYQQSEALRQDTRAVSLARELMEEIAAKPFADPNAIAGEEFHLGPDTGETAGNRATYDNVDDYDGFADNTNQGVMKTASGQAINFVTTEYFSRSVKVEYRTAPAGPAGNGDFALVTVTVTTAKGRTVQLSRLFTKTTIAN